MKSFPSISRQVSAWAATLLTISSSYPLQAGIIFWDDGVGGNSDWGRGGNWNGTGGAPDNSGEDAYLLCNNTTYDDGANKGVDSGEMTVVIQNESSGEYSFTIGELVVVTNAASHDWVFNNGDSVGTIRVTDAVVFDLVNGGSLTMNSNLEFTDNSAGFYAAGGNRAVLSGQLIGAETCTVDFTNDYTRPTENNQAAGSVFGGGLVLANSDNDEFLGTLKVGLQDLEVTEINGVRNATIDINSHGSFFFPSQAEVGAITGTYSLEVPHTLRVGGSNNDGFEYGGKFTGSGAIVKAGTGVWELSGNGAHTGAFTVSGGQIKLLVGSGSNLSLQDSELFLFPSSEANGPVVFQAPGATVGALGGGGKLNLGSHTLLIDGKDSGVFAGNHWGQIYGAGAIVIDTDGTQEIRGSNTYNGGTQLLGGTLICEASDNLGNSGGGLLMGDAVFNAQASHDQGQALTFEASSSVTEFLVNNGVALTWSGLITGNSGSQVIKKTGDGSMSFSNGGNDFTGSLEVEAGSIEISGDVMAGAVVDITSGASMIASTTDATIASLKGDGTVSLADGINLTSGDNDQSTTYIGDLSGAGSFTKTGTGEFTFSGASTLSGGIVLNEGTLEINGALATSTLTSLTAASGTILKGTARGSAAWNVDGTLAPRNGVSEIGTFRAGSMTLGGTFECDLAGASNDLLAIDGSFDPSSATASFSFSGGAPNQAAYVLATYGSLSGRFASTAGIPAGYRLDYAYNGNQIALIVDSTNPTVTSVTPDTGTPTSSSTVSFTVVFSEEVSGFDIATDVKINAPETVEVSGVDFDSSDNQTFTVDLWGVTGNGNLSLEIESGSHIQDLAQNALSSGATSSVVEIDNTGATVVSITPSETGPTNANSISFDVTFSEAVYGFNSFADLAVGSTGTAGASGSTIVVGDNVNSYTVTLTGVTGDGTLTLAVETGAGVLDEADNELVSSVTSSGVEIDNTGPSVASFTSVTSSPSNADSISYSLTFDEEVTGFSGVEAGVVNAASADFAQAVFTNTGDNTTFTVTLSDITGDGLLTVQPKTDLLKDMAGNSIVNSPALSSQGIVIDQTPPVISLIGDANLVHPLGSAWVDPGADVTDTLDTELTAVISGDQVLIDTVGVYTVLYDATDTAGNAADQVSREVEVVFATIYVDIARAGQGTQDGTSWATAFASLQDALAATAAGKNQTIHIAQGVYYPDQSELGHAVLEPVDRDNVFKVLDEVTLLGGYPSGGGVRNPEVYLTVLSGDVDGDDTVDGNGVRYPDVNGGFDSGNAGPVVVLDDAPNAVLDGVTVTAGSNVWLNAGAANTSPYPMGGGIHLTNGGNLNQVNVFGCAVQDDFSQGYGGAVAVMAGNCVMTSCEFARNDAEAGEGGALYLAAGSTIVRQSSVTGNAANNGGGISVGAGSLILDGVAIQGNQAAVGEGGIRSVDGGALQGWNCLIAGNLGISGVGGLNVNGPTVLTNCTIAGNFGGAGAGGLEVSGSQTLLQNTIVWENSVVAAVDAQDDLGCSGGSVTYAYSNVASSGAVLPGTITDGGNNISADPAFRQPDAATASAASESGDFRLSGNSASLNVGDNAADLDGSGAMSDLVSSLTQDLAGQARITASVVDQGAFEYGGVTIIAGPAGELVMDPQASAFSDVDTSGWFDGDGLSYSADSEHAGLISAQIDAAGLLTVTALTSGESTVRVTATDENGFTAYVELFVRSTPGVIYVDASRRGSGSQNGLSWGTAFAELTDALAVAVEGEGQSIYLAEGVYYPHLEEAGFASPDLVAKENMFLIKDGINVYGGYPAGGGTRDLSQYHTVLSGDVDVDDAVNAHGVLEVVGTGDAGNAWTVVLMLNSPNSELNGVVVTSGSGGDNSPAIDGVTSSNHAAGVVITNGGTLSSVRIVGNAGGDRSGGFANAGGLAVHDGECLIKDCEVSGNRSAGDGGGILAESNAEIIGYNILVSGNHSAGNGGAIYDASGGVWTNCTVAGNHADGLGGGFYLLTNAGRLQNSIIWGNESDGVSGNNLSIQNPAVVLVACCFQDVDGTYQSAGGNHSSDPLFVQAELASSAPSASGNYRLTGYSPSINDGSNIRDLDGAGPGIERISDVVYDLDGNARTVFSTVDQGAYEYFGVYRVDTPTLANQFANAGVLEDLIDLAAFSGGATSYAITGNSDPNVATATVDPVSGLVDITVLIGGSTDFEFTISGAGGSTVVFDVALEVVPIALRVNPALAGPGSESGGATWSAPMANLNEALAIVIDGQEIWLAQGVYYPDSGIGGAPDSNDPDASFVIPSGVKIYGGFAGTPGEVLADRDPDTNVTVLSGDIDGNDVGTDSDGILTGLPEASIVGVNSRHLMVLPNAASARLIDGVVLTAARTDGASSDGGSALRVEGGSVTVKDCRITGNWNDGNSNGAGVSVTGGPVEFEACEIDNNLASADNAGLVGHSGSVTFTAGTIQNNRATNGAGLACLNSSMTIDRSFIRGQESTQSGGGVRVEYGLLRIYNTVISGNLAGQYGGGVWIAASGANLDIVNCTIAGNRAGSQGGGVQSEECYLVNINNTIVAQNSALFSSTDNIGLTYGEINATASLLSGVLLSSPGGGGGTGGSGGGGSSGTGGGPQPGKVVDYGGCFTGVTVFAAVEPALNAPTTAGDYSLTSSSFGIDQGYNGLLSGAYTADISGGTRIVDGFLSGSVRIDMGAFEYQGSPVQIWRRQYGLDEYGSDDDNVLSDDGLTALMKYAFNMGDPSVSAFRNIDLNNPEAGGRPFTSEVNGVATFSYIRPANGIGDVYVEVEASRDLQDGSWDYWGKYSDLLYEETVELLEGGEYQLHQIKIDTSEGDEVFFRVFVDEGV